MTYCVCLKLGYEEARFLFKEAQEAINFAETAMNTVVSGEGARDVEILITIDKEVK